LKESGRIRHNRIIGIGRMIETGKTESEIISHCLNNLKVSKPTAVNYFETVAAPYRAKYQKEMQRK